MYETLSVDQSIFIIDKPLVEQFIHQVNLHKKEQHLILDKQINEINSWSILLNIWLNGEHAKHFHIVKPEIELFYSADIAFIRLLNCNELYLKFVGNSDESERFIFAHTITQFIIDWVSSHIQVVGWSKYTEFNEDVPYYSLYQVLNIESSKRFIVGQSLLMKRIMQYFGKQDHLNLVIRESVKKIKLKQLQYFM